MRPVIGVLIELVALGAAASIGAAVPRGSAFALYMVVVELLATYLIHCPAHYLVGMATGIRFRSIRLGRTTLARVLPPRAAGLARLLPVLTLTVDRSSLAKASNLDASIMYASGTVASVCAAFVAAIASTWTEPAPLSAIAWAVALVYLAFDAVFSPRGGDLMRAKRAVARRQD